MVRVISSIYILIPLFRAILLMSAGGEMNMIMVTVHEQVPTRHRSKAALLGINFINMRTLIPAGPNPRPGRRDAVGPRSRAVLSVRLPGRYFRPR